MTVMRRTTESDLVGPASTWAAAAVDMAGESLLRVQREFDIGTTRADLAVITDTSIWAWEIKSGADNLNRLQRQGTDYGTVANHCGLICDQRWTDRAIQLIPAYWTVVEASGPPSDQTLHLIRQGTPSPDTDPYRLVRYLWAPEARTVASVLKGRRYHTTGNSRHKMWDLITAELENEPDLLAAIVRAHLAVDTRDRQMGHSVPVGHLQTLITDRRFADTKETTPT